MRAIRERRDRGDEKVIEEDRGKGGGSDEKGKIGNGLRSSLGDVVKEG